MTVVPTSSQECRYCQEPRVPQARFCTRCGLPTADACPACDHEIPLATASCGGCHAPLVHCPGCGRNYTVEHVRCENTDWKCEGTLLREPCPSHAGLHANLHRTRSQGLVAPHPGRLGAPAWVFEDARHPVLDVVTAYGRVYVWTPELLVSFPEDIVPDTADGRVTASHPRMQRSERLAAAGRGYGPPAEMTVAYGQVCVLAPKGRGGSEVLTFRADDIEIPSRLEIEGACSAIPLPEGCLAWTDADGSTEAHWIQLGATAPDASAPVSSAPEPSWAPASVDVDEAGTVTVLYRGRDERVVALGRDDLAERILLEPDERERRGPAAIDGDVAFVLGRVGNAEATRVHRFDLRAGRRDSCELNVGTDLLLRGTGSRRYVHAPATRSWHVARVDPWPARLDPERLSRPANEEIMQDLLVQHGAPGGIVALAQDSGRLEIRLLTAEGDHVLHPMPGDQGRFVVSGSLLLVWEDGKARLEAYRL